jgi:hypothetical protein
MILVDAVLPDCCLNCFAGAGYGCAITGQPLVSGEMCGLGRPADCPLIEVEERTAPERISHVSWENRTCYVRREEENHDR